MVEDASEKTELMEKDPYLKLSAVYRFFREFNRKCNTIDDFKCSSQLSNLKAETKELHIKFLRNIEKLSKHNHYFNEIDNGNNLEKRCIYLKYWLYHKLLSNGIENNDIDTLLGSLDSEKNYILSDSYFCKFYKMDKKYIIELKKLYDYFLFYNLYKKHTVIDDKINQSVHCSYIKGIHDLFSKYVNECTEHESHDYCEEFNTYIKSYVNNTELSSLKDKCKIDETPTESQRKDEDIGESSLKNANNRFNIFVDMALYQEKESDSSIDEYTDNFKNAHQSIRCGNSECKDNVKNICENFIKLFSKLYKTQKDINYYPLYLNYWFNKKLKEIGITDTERKEACEGFSNICSEENKMSILKDKIHYIEDNDYKKMNILYDMYDNYNKIKRQEFETSENYTTGKCLEYSKVCLEKYMEGIKIYYENEDSQFYDALNVFRILYRNVKGRSKSCINVTLSKLPQFISLEELNKQNPKKEIIEECESITANTSVATINERNIYEDIFKDFSEYGKYKKLNERPVDKIMCTNYCEKCISLDNKYPGIKGFCAKMASNLKNLYSIQNMEGTHFNRCSYLTYWSYDLIMNTLNSSVNNTLDESISSELNNIMFQINSILSDNEKCLYTFHGNFDDWREEKDLHDYFENYDSLFNVNLYNDTKGKHCNYVNYIYGLYKRHITDCCKCYNDPQISCDNECPNYFKCDEKYFPNNLLSHFKCNDKISDKEKNIVFGNATIDRIVLWITKVTHEKTKLSRTSNTDAPSTSETISETTNNESLYDPFFGGMLICFVFLGILLLFFIFYRFTPIGSWFNKNGKKEIIMHNFHEENMNQFLDYDSNYDSNYGNLNSRRKRIHLNYHPE
ncbi:PIR Superfamily Protein [Plasmodium ovale curtisi]|uniref:PIR Superfamily Protein n=1 Tax=Plasmodium ovale curtisi TaxID=864141 RepID=A0A1A8XBH9_PLAOA|nr:PIR Superfamily Protein [Plasmodium ovale curtisi]SBT02557.1 PIR Superfamily Protein [Plasmodium ovale curtisi]